ncbi:MAG: NUDIX domain-containing protein [Candidatus Tectomicrobia bacterium]|uniref:NUDIX domain-containing protein n=1 Tax=Tectimicrobiota bacterium TaxID=2528274 RepID=A0A933GLY9_UNCTE|nr:NUDIX domain-containing protein [Candidatus Tectomicrobia bacterium]
MSKKSAGLLLFREISGELEVLLVHPGGPFWEKKDEGAWSIPKGEIDDAEDPFSAAKREFVEETGAPPGSDSFIALQPVRQPSGKLVYSWALRADFDPATLKSNMFSMEWPPKSGRQQEFPEIDRAEWFTIPLAKQKILKGQVPILDQLQEKLAMAPNDHQSEGIGDSG